MISEVGVSKREIILKASGLDPAELKNLVIVDHFGNTAVRRHLEKLPIEDYSSAMIMADEDNEADLMHSDSHTLATLLLFRDIQRCVNCALLATKSIPVGTPQVRRAHLRRCLPQCDVLSGAV